MRRLTVLQSFRTPRPTTNPYVIQLADSLRHQDVHVVNWTWRAALCGRFDVFHAHWPEVLVDGSTPTKKIARQFCYLLFLIRLRLTKRPLVRTVHNLELPQEISRRERLLLRLTERWTTLRIALNDSTPQSGHQAWALILHGHYRDWFARERHFDVIPGRIGYFGLIRRYKSVDSLVSAFVSLTPSSSTTLIVAGKPSTEELAESLVKLAADDPRVEFEFKYLEDAELVRVATESELVVLPYREMHNSGAALTALSLGRPVLVPRNRVNAALQAEVGPEWLHMYEGKLTSEKLEQVLHLVQSTPRTEPPNLSGRDWTQIARAHEAAYRRALDLARPH